MSNDKSKSVVIGDGSEEDILTRTFVISEETYKHLLAVTAAADKRGLNSSMEYYLSSFVKQGAKVRMDLWSKSDANSILAQAQKGNASAKESILRGLGFNDAQIKAMSSVK